MSAQAPRPISQVFAELAALCMPAADETPDQLAFRLGVIWNTCSNADGMSDSDIRTLYVPKYVQSPDTSGTPTQRLNAIEAALERLNARIMADETKQASVSELVNQLDSIVPGLQQQIQDDSAALAAGQQREAELTQELAAAQAANDPATAAKLTNDLTILRGLLRLVPPTVPASAPNAIQQAPAVLPLYTHNAPGAFDATEWPLAPVTTDAGVPLYKFAGDIAGQPARGSSAEWQVYAGVTLPAPSSAAPAAPTMVSTPGSAAVLPDGSVAAGTTGATGETTKAVTQ